MIPNLPSPLRRILIGRAWLYVGFALFCALGAGLGWALVGLGEWRGGGNVPYLVVCHGALLFFGHHAVRTFRMARHVDRIPIASVAGYALVRDAVYQHRVRIAGASRGGPGMVMHHIINIGGIDYVLAPGEAPPPEDRPICLRFVMLRMPFFGQFGGRLSRFVVGYEVLAGEAAARAEAEIAMVGADEDLAANATGRLSTRQLRALRWAKWRGTLLGVGIAAPIAVGLGFGCVQWFRAGEASATVWILLGIGVVAMAVCVVLLLSTVRYVRALPQSQVQHFTGLVEKVTAVPGGRVETGTVYLRHGEQRFWAFPDALMQRIPQARPATYYYFVDRGTKTIIHLVMAT